MSAAERKSILQMTLCSVLWSISGVLIKLIPWNAMVLAGLRSLISAGVFAVYFVLSRRRFTVDRRMLRLALMIPAMSICFIFANKLTTAANAIVLQYTAPVFLLLYESLFRKKRFRAGDYWGVAFTMAGVGLFFLDQLKGGALLGNLLAILAGMFFAGTMFSVEDVGEDARLSGLALGHLMTAVVGVPFLFLYGAPMRFESAAAILVLGVFQLGIPYILYGLAASHCPPLTLTLLAALEPILNPVWVFLFIGEAPGRTALLGGVLVLVSVTLWCLWDARRKMTAVSAGERA